MAYIARTIDSTLNTTKRDPITRADLTEEYTPTTTAVLKKDKEVSTEKPMVKRALLN